MKEKLLSGVLAIILLAVLAGCSSIVPTPHSNPTPIMPMTAAAEPAPVAPAPADQAPIAPAREKSAPAEQTPDIEEISQPAEAKLTPDGDIVDGALATQDNPVPFGTWATVTARADGKVNTAYARISEVITDQKQAQVFIDEYNSKNPNGEIPSLEEHAEFLDYVVVEYEVFFPDDFTDYDRITFYGLIFSRENNQERWIASDGSNYYWMGSVITIDTPSRETGYPHNGDTVKCRIVYPMIKDYTDYTLLNKERVDYDSDYIYTYFSIA